ncbi:uncharacterized protein BO66DRAFT_255537 [Aspergillus aculeatinus CBS 121060]|uniref:Uncharacterized protein n=1 Tax=Aspergillus aculeatinus CBS 121060 TaxID=1448322 RepID=A0ACD1GS42_9EURO|nr:hypothetical protein BO66DRAFT_255537 [Aspergillus aculeatinus CBS 121060]RAH64019.1 hypothetical protein BO66DRAFT_255537 [Aspergillus aculeatinus CBS 121060]
MASKSTIIGGRMSPMIPILTTEYSAGNWKRAPGGLDRRFLIGAETQTLPVLVTFFFSSFFQLLLLSIASATTVAVAVAVVVALSVFFNYYFFFSFFYSSSSSSPSFREFFSSPVIPYNDFAFSPPLLLRSPLISILQLFYNIRGAVV